MFKKISLTVLLFALATPLAIYLFSTPSHHRDWQTSQSRLSQATFVSPDQFTLTNIRDWSYGDGVVINQHWFDRGYDLSELQAIWFALDPFSGGGRIAHTMLTFEFDSSTGPEYLTLSIEARHESDESYSALMGVLRRYELIYVWSGEKDAYTRRTLFYGDDLYHYRLDLTAADARFVLRSMLDETNILYDQPRFYNTLFHNCTNGLASAINDRAEQRLVPWHYSFVVTGRSPEYLYNLGYVSTDRSFEQLQTEALLTQRTKAYQDLVPQRFSEKIRGR